MVLQPNNERYIQDESSNSNVIPNSPDMCDGDIQNEQNNIESNDERVALASLIANLKLDVDENKKIQKQLKKANTTLAQELKECKTILAETSKTLGESNSVRDSCLVALQNKQTEFEKYKAFNDHTVDNDKHERKLNETLGQLAQKDIEIKEGLKTKAYEISVVKEKHDELIRQSLLTKSHYAGLFKQKTKVTTDLKLKEEHDIDKMLSMEKQLNLLNEIVYKRSQSIQTIHMMASKLPTYNGRPTFVNPRYLKQAQSEIPCLYAFPYDQSTHANRLIPDREETLALERESRSKLNKDLVCPYDYITLNSLYENLKPPTQEFEIQLAHANEIKKKMWRKSFVKYKPSIYKNVRFLPVLKSISKRRQAYNVMTNNINHFKKIVDNAWIKHSKDQFRAPTAQDMEILIQTCLMPLAIKDQNDSFLFVHELMQEMHADLKYVESLEKEIDELEFDKAEFSNMYDVILQECVSKDVMCCYLLSLSNLDGLDELQWLYLHKVKECDCLAQKLSKQTEYVTKEVYNELLRRFAKLEKHSVSLDLALQKCKEQVKNDTIWNEKASNVFRKEREQYIKIQDLKAQLQYKNIAISELKKLIEKGKGKSMDTKFDKPSVVRQLNAQRIPKPLVLGKPAPFSNSLKRIYFSKTKSVPKTNVSEGLLKQVTAQTLPQTARQAIVQLILFIVDSGCTKHMTGNLKLLCNYVEKFLGFITSKASITISSQLVSFVMRIWRLLFGNLHVLLEIFRDIVIGLPKLKYVKDQLCSSCELSKAKRSSFKSKAVPSLKGRLNLLHVDLCNPMRVASINRKKYILRHIVLKQDTQCIFKEGRIKHQTSTARTPEKNGVVKRRNHTLVEAARTMLSASKLPLFFWAEAIATACYTQNRSIIIPTHDKTAYHIVNDMKPLIKHLHIFGCTCYITRDGENLDKMKEKRDLCILVGYSTQSKGYRVYNKRTRMIVEPIHIRFDEIKEVFETSVANDTSGLVPQRQNTSDYYNPDPVPQ
nr:hypothetical protein [Tanacetum cinerariifolium]